MLLFKVIKIIDCNKFITGCFGHIFVFYICLYKLNIKNEKIVKVRDILN